MLQEEFFFIVEFRILNHIFQCFAQSGFCLKWKIFLEVYIYDLVKGWGD